MLALWELNPYRGAFLVAGESQGTRARLAVMPPTFQAKREGFIFRASRVCQGPLSGLCGSQAESDDGSGRRACSRLDVGATPITLLLGPGALGKNPLMEPSSASGGSCANQVRARRLVLNYVRERGLGWQTESAKTFQKRRELHPGFQGVAIKPSKKSPSRKSPAGLKINSIIDS